MSKLCNKHLSEPVKLEVDCVGCELERIKLKLQNIIEKYETEHRIILRLLIMFIEDSQLKSIKELGIMAGKILDELEAERKNANHKAKISDS